MSITTVPLLTDLCGPWRELAVEMVGPGAPPASPVRVGDIYPFVSVTDFKRQLWIQQSGDPRWAPEHVFVGVRRGDGLRPIEFYWPAHVTNGARELPDPVAPAARVPSPALVNEAGVRRPLGPTMIGTVTLEDALMLDILPTNTLPVITAISLAALVPSAETDMTPALFGGFYQMYFPWLTAPGQVFDATLTSPSVAMREAYAAALPYIEDRTGRTDVVQRALAKGVAGTAATMTSMVRIRWLLPPPAERPASLEKTFYGLAANVRIPFLRYFPVSGTPILKLGLKENGAPLIEDEKVLAQYIHQPAPTLSSAVILARAPLHSRHAEPGAAFTIYMFEDGHSDITLEAPHRGATYIAAVAKDAEQILETLIPALGFSEQSQLRLVDLQATYRWSHPAPERATPLSAQRILERIAALTPFFAPMPTEEKALATFHWRAVSNYESESAKFAYITQMVNRAAKGGGGMEEGTSAYIAYRTELSQKFGIPERTAGELLEQWLERHGAAVAPAIGADAGLLAVPRHSTGATVSIRGTHPEYTVELQNVDSGTDLQRIMSVVGVLLGAQSSELSIAPPIAPIVAMEATVSFSNAAMETNAILHGGPPEEPVSETLFDPALDDLLGELGFGGDDEGGAEETPVVATAAEETATPAAAAVEAALPAVDIAEGGECHANPWRAGEPALPSLHEYYIKRLGEADSVLFGSWKGKTAKPLAGISRGCVYSKSCQSLRQPNIMTQAEYARVRRCYAGRVEFIVLPPRGPEDLPRLPAAEAAFFVGKYAPRRKEHVEEYLRTVFQNQYIRNPVTGMPMWNIYGYENKTRPGEFMYVMSAELWCERDNLPLIHEEFAGTQGRGFTKEPNTCPFCGGRVVETLAKPRHGESVIQRKSKPGTTDPVYVHIMRIRHPDGYLLPCSSPKPKLIEQYLIPAIQDRLQYGQATPAAVGAGGDEDDETPTLVEGERVDYLQRLGAMNTQYILNYDKTLEAGKIGLLPPALDAFFGQNSQRSVESRGIRPTFVREATVFVRVGVDTRMRAPGLNFFAGLAPLMGLESAEEVRAYVKQHITPASFEAANYGTLVQEFAAKSQMTEDELVGALQGFATANGYQLDGNRAHVVRVMRAYDAFQRYMDDPLVPKQVRHFEHLLAYPGILQTRGLLLVTLEQEGDHVRVVCPSFGIPTSSVFGSVPIAFVWHDRRDESWEPLVLYNGTKDAVRLFGDRLQDVPQPQREAIRGWLRTWRAGCGRPAPPPHVWTPDRETSGLPRLYAMLMWSALRLRSLLRDRSNRLAGGLFEVKGKPGTVVYVPMLDDGTLVDVPRVFEADMIPSAPAAAYIDVYRSLAAQYSALTPVSYLLRKDDGATVGFQVAAGTMIPLAADAGKGPALPEDPRFVDEFVWERDAVLLRAPDAPALTAIALSETLATADEQLDEAYQHVRLALSRWLVRDAAGPVLQQNLMRLIASNLPYFEKTKRMDILLEPHVRQWILTTDGAEPRALSLLREDCLSVPTEEACDAASSCRWSEGRCMIHAPSSATVPEPARVFTARLTDEILRYTGKRTELFEDNVETIRAPRGVVRVGDELYMSLKPKESATAVLQRLGFAGQAALTFPEEMLRFDGLDEGDEVVPPPSAEEDEQLPRTLVDLPASWTSLGFTIPTPGPDVLQAKQLAFAAITGQTIENWGKYIQMRRRKFGLPGDVERPFQWSVQDFYVIATILLSNVIFIRQTREGRVIIDKWIAPMGGVSTYSMFFWGPRQLLVSRGKMYRFMAEHLPTEVQAAMDAASPIPEEEARGQVEETVSPPASVASPSSEAESEISMPPLETITDAITEGISALVEAITPAQQPPSTTESSGGPPAPTMEQPPAPQPAPTMESSGGPPAPQPAPTMEASGGPPAPQPAPTMEASGGPVTASPSATQPAPTMEASGGPPAPQPAPTMEASGGPVTAPKTSAASNLSI